MSTAPGTVQHRGELPATHRNGNKSCPSAGGIHQKHSRSGTIWFYLTYNISPSSSLMILLNSRRRLVYLGKAMHSFSVYDQILLFTLGTTHIAKLDLPILDHWWTATGGHATSDRLNMTYLHKTFKKYHIGERCLLVENDEQKAADILLGLQWTSNLLLSG